MQLFDYFLRLLLSLVLLLSCPLAWSVRNYDIELIIFRYTDNQQYLSEQWQDTWYIPNTEESLDLDTVSPVKENLDLNIVPPEEENPFRTLTEEETTLNSIVEALSESERYHVLTYLAWQQPGLDKDNAIDIKIQAGQAYRQLTRLRKPELPEQEAPEDQTIEYSLPQMGSLFVSREELDVPVIGYVEENDYAVTIEYEPLVSISDDDVVQNRESVRKIPDAYRPIITPDSPDNFPEAAVDTLIYELTGNIKFVVSRFIHVYIDLLFMQPVILELEQAKTKSDIYTEFETESISSSPGYRILFGQPDAEFNTLHGFNIKAHRRMRSRELHYIDHPLLGMVIKAWPVPKKIELEENDDAIEDQPL